MLNPRLLRVQDHSGLRDAITHFRNQAELVEDRLALYEFAKLIEVGEGLDVAFVRMSLDFRLGDLRFLNSFVVLEVL